MRTSFPRSTKSLDSSWRCFIKIKIQWLSDEHDCDTCGGSYAEGAKITFEDGELKFAPSAHCFGGKSWSESEIYKLILQDLGHVIEEIYEDDKVPLLGL